MADFQMFAKEFACSGVRSLQRMRRSHSNPVRRPPRRGLEADLFAATLRQLGYSSAVVNSVQRLAPLKPMTKRPTEPPKTAASRAEGRAMRTMQCPQTYFGNPVYSYEELFALRDAHTMADLDQDVEIPQQATKCDIRSFYGRELHSYEDFFYLVGETCEMFDDEAQAISKQAACARTYYCRTILAYEELFALLGHEQGLFDDEAPTASKAQIFHYFGRELHSYEEL